MSKPPSPTPQKVITIIKKKGFVLERIRGSHVHYHPENKRRVVIPFHEKDLPIGTLLEILRQASIEKEDLRDSL